MPRKIEIKKDRRLYFGISYGDYKMKQRKDEIDEIMEEILENYPQLKDNYAMIRHIVQITKQKIQKKPNDN